MKKFLVIMIMVLLCSTSVMAQKGKGKSRNRKAKVESQFVKQQKEDKELVDLYKSTYLLSTYGPEASNEYRNHALIENDTKDFNLTKHGRDTIYNGGTEYHVYVNKEGKVDTLEVIDWAEKSHYALEKENELLKMQSEMMEREKEHRALMAEIDAEIAFAENTIKNAEKELEKYDFSWVYDYTYFGKKKVGVKWDYRPKNNKEFDNDEMLSKLSLWIGKETGDYFEFSTEKNGKKYTTVEINFINGMTKHVDVYKSGKKRSIKKKQTSEPKEKLAKLSGMVKDKDGLCMFGAFVEVTNEVTGKKYYTTVEGNGTFAIDKILADGTYNIKITKSYYNDIEFNGVTLEPKDKNHLNVQMERKNFFDPLVVGDVMIVRL